MSILSSYDYPGRIVILGKNSDSYVSIYAVTGRNPSSKAKRYTVTNANCVTVEASSEIMALGNLDLLQYDCIHLYEDGIVIGNGRQVSDVAIVDSNSLNTAEAILRSNLKDWSFEDDKHKTPRITGVINIRNNSTALSIIRSQKGELKHDVYGLNLQVGEAYFLCTYAGDNIKPTPSFKGGPLQISIDLSSPKSSAENVYSDLAPKQSYDDLRVSVIALYQSIKTGKRDFYIINSLDLI